MQIWEQIIQGIQKIDDTIILFLHNHMHYPILDNVMVAITYLGEFGLLWIVIALLLCIFKKYRRYGVTMLCALIITAMVANLVMKPLIERPRPFLDLPDLKLLIPPPKGFSFPSGHSSSSFVCAGILFGMNKKWGGLALFTAALIAFSRVYLGVHYPSDVLVGMILGLIIAVLSLKILYCWEEKHKNPMKVIRSR